MRHSISILFLALGVAACGSSGNNGSSPDPSPCSQDTTAETYTAGMWKTSTGGVKVAIESATPAPPAEGKNAWTLFITDANGAPISDAKVSVVCAMYHPGTLSHGCAVAPVIVNAAQLDGGASGEYDVSELVFNMAGHWDVTITVDRGTGTKETVTFSFCLP